MYANEELRLLWDYVAPKILSFEEQLEKLNYGNNPIKQTLKDRVINWLYKVVK